MPTSLFSGIPLEFPPLKTDHWSLIFPPSMNISERFEVKAARPKLTNHVVELKYKSSWTKYKGSTKFENMEIEFRDIVGPAVMQKFWNWQREHYDPATGCGGYPSIYMKDLILYMEDDCGNPVQKWTLYGCFLENLDGGSLDMEQDGVNAMVKMTIAYQHAELNY